MMSPAKKTRKSARKTAKKGKRKATPKQLAALKKARAMKAVRARAKTTPGGKGLIKNRPAARRILGK
ncbi:MAG TPA: hypothetical protein VM286_04975 [Candidatus Thermoplasmatota archaeon]|nr:hypothetical protein [Candidatus Thermoplasmatota archaeon]